MSLDEWFDKFYGASPIDREATAALLEFIASDVGIQATQIYPSDTFDDFRDDLSHILDDPLEAVDEEFRRYMRKRCPDRVPPSIDDGDTVGDAINCISTFLSERAISSGRSKTDE